MRWTPVLGRAVSSCVVVVVAFLFVSVVHAHTIDVGAAVKVSQERATQAPRGGRPPPYCPEDEQPVCPRPYRTLNTVWMFVFAQECFFEDLHTEDKMTVTYQVAGGGHLDIDFWLSGPGDRVMNEQRKRDTGTYSFTAEVDGRYTYCFSNEMSTVTGKTVSFNVHGVMYVEDDGHTAPIEKEIRTLSQALEAVKDEQEYIVVRERIHRDTAESTNSRVKYWSIVQTLMLISVCAFQVFYLKRFFEVKRAVVSWNPVVPKQVIQY